MIKFLISEGTDPSEQSALDGSTAMSRSGITGSIPCFEYLMSQGGACFVNGFSIKDQLNLSMHAADVDEQDHQAFTALITASAYGHIDAVKFLLDHGANLYHKTTVDMNAYLAAGLKLLLASPSITYNHNDFSWQWQCGAAPISA